MFLPTLSHARGNEAYLPLTSNQSHKLQTSLLLELPELLLGYDGANGKTQQAGI